MRALTIRRIALAATTIAGVLALSSASLAVSQAVSIDTFRFVPAAVTVNVGDSVTWTNRDAAQHTATAPGVFDTGTLSQGQSRAIVMGTAGTFAYRCSIHPTMTGTVQVIGAAAPTPAPTSAPTPPLTPVPTPPPPAVTGPPPTPAPATPGPTAPPTSALVVPPTATAPAIAPAPTPAPATATATLTAAPVSPTQVAAQLPVASSAGAVVPSDPGTPASASRESPGGLIALAGAVTLAGAAAALVLWRSRRRAA